MIDDQMRDIEMAQLTARLVERAVRDSRRRLRDYFTPSAWIFIQLVVIPILFFIGVLLVAAATKWAWLYLRL